MRLLLPGSVQARQLLHQLSHRVHCRPAVPALHGRNHRLSALVPAGRGRGSDLSTKQAGQEAGSWGDTVLCMAATTAWALSYLRAVGQSMRIALKVQSQQSHVLSMRLFAYMQRRLVLNHPSAC